MRSVLFLLHAIFALILAAQVQAQEMSLRTPGIQTDGEVYALTRSQSKLFVGGSFDQIGFRTGSGAVLNTSTGMPDLPYGLVDGEVRAAVPDQEGGWYIGGSFASVDGTQRSGLARIRKDKTLDPDWNPGFAGSTYHSLALRNGILYVGGAFSNVGGQSRTNLASLDGTTGQVTTWNPQVNGEVRALAFHQDTLYIGGTFTTVNAQPRGRLAGFNVTANQILDQPAANLDGTVHAIVVDSKTGMIFAGGEFANVNAILRQRVAQFNLAGNLQQLSLGFNNTVHALHLVSRNDCNVEGFLGDALVLVGGNFTTAGATNRNRLASFYPYATGGAVLTNWNPGANGIVYSLSSRNCTAFVGGDFTTLANTERNFIGALSLTSGEVTSWNPNANNTVRVLSRIGDRMFAGGNFTSIGRVARNNLASIDLENQTVTSWNPMVDGPVNALLADNGYIYFGGDFGRVGDQVRSRVGRILISDGVLSTWNPSPNGTVHALLEDKGNIFIGGEFSRCGSRSRQNLALVDNTGKAITNWTPNPNGPIYSLAKHQNRVYVGGDYNTIANQVIYRNLSALFIATGGADPNWVANADGPVRAMAVRSSNGRLYIGGDFLTIQFINATQELISYVAAVTLADGVILPNWRPIVDRPVRALAVSQTSPHVYIGGEFTLSPGARLASVDTVGGASGAFNADIGNGIVHALFMSGRSLYVGGTFTTIGTRQQQSLGEFTDCTAKVNIEATANSLCPGETATLTAIASGFGRFTYNWTPTTGLSLASNGRIATASPNSSTTYTLVITDGEGCKAAQAYSLTVNQAPIADAGPNLTICRGDSARLDASGGSRFVWSAPGNNSFSTSARPWVKPTTTTTYTVLVTDNAGCTSLDLVTVNLFAVPLVDAGFNTTVCNDVAADSVQLVATGAISFVWLPVTGMGNASVFNPKVRPAATTIYTVTGTDGNGCRATDTVQVRVGAPPTVDVQADRVLVCAGDTVRLTATGSIDVMTYSWAPANRFGNNPFGVGKIDRPTDTTMYYVTAFGEFCQRTDSIQVNVLARPMVEAGPSRAICKGTPVQLGISGVGNYLWEPADGLNATDIPQPIAEPLITTTYTVTLTNPTTGCFSKDQVTVIVFNLPDVNAGPDKTSCNGNPVQLSASGGPTVTSYNWSPPAGLLQTQGSDVTAAPNVTTTYTVVVEDENGCRGSDAVTVVVSQRPVPNLGSDLSVCKGTAVPLFAQGGITFEWNPPIYLDDSEIPNPISTPDTTVTYTVRVTNAAGCVGFDDIRINVLMPPMADAGMDTTICFNSSVPLRATGGLSYVWTPAAAIQGPANIANPIASPTESTTYTVLVSDQNSCTAIDSVTVFFRDPPVVDAGPDLTGVCPFADKQLTVTSGVRYEWLPPISLNSDTIQSPISTTITSRTYTVFVTDQFGCVGRDEVLIDVDTVITVDAGENVEVCLGNSSQLQAEMRGIKPRWEPTKGLSDYLISNPIVQPDTTTVYYYFVTGENGCEGLDSLTVEVYALPVPVMGNDTLICPNGTATLMASGGISYNWSPSETLNDNTSDMPEATPAVSTTYTVLVTDANGCSAQGMQKVTVFVAPEIPLFVVGSESQINITDTTFCGKAGSVQMATIDRPGYSYQWLNLELDLEEQEIAGARASRYTAESAGQYVLRVGIGGCTATSRQINIFVNPLPIANAGVDRYVCNPSDGAQLNATGGGNYSWSPVRGLDNAASQSPIAKPEVTTAYIVTVTDGNGCSAKDTIIVFANNVRNIVASANGKTTACEGTRVELTATTGPGFSYQWLRNETAIQGASFSTYFATSSGKYSVRITLLGCPARTSNEVEVNILPDPLVTISGGGTVCEGSSTQLTAIVTGVTGAVTYLWAPSAGLSNRSISNPSARPERTTTYTVTVSNSAGCSKTAFVTVTVANFSQLPRPQIFSGGSYSICPGSTINLQARNNATGFDVSYQWRRNNISIPNATADSYSTSQEGLYTVVVSSINCGSSVSEAVRVVIRKPPVISSVIKNATCQACSDGEIFISATEGQAPYRYSIDGRNFYTARIFTNLTVGTYTLSVRDSVGCVSSEEVQVLVEPTSRTRKYDESNLAVYPNPSQGQFTVRLSNPPFQPVLIGLYDLLGKKVMEQRVTPAGSRFEYEIDMQDRADGVYFLTLTLPDGQRITRKVVKK